MKRIAVSVLSLGMLAVTSTRANYHDTVQGAAMRPDYRGYDHTRYMQSGMEGNYAPQSYWEQGKMRPDYRGYDHQRFEGGFEDRTSSRKNYIGHKKNRYTGPGGVRVRHDARVSDRRERWNEGYVGRHGTWLGKGNAPNLPGTGGQNPEDMAKQQYQQY